MQRGHILTLIATFFGSIYYVLAKQVMQTIPVSQFVYLLFSFSLCFNLIFFFRPTKMPQFHRPTIYTSLVFCLLSICGNFLMGESLKLLHPAMTVVIQRTQIFFVIILSYFFLNDEINKKTILGAFIALAGIVIIQPPMNSSIGLEQKGIYFALCAALCFGMSQVFVRKNIFKIKPQSVNIIRLFFALSLMSLNPFLWQNWTPLTQTNLIFIITSALIGPTFARLLLFHALKTITAAETVLFTMLSPVIVMILMFVFYEQRLLVHQLIGGGIILLGVFFSLSPLNLLKSLYKKSLTRV